MPARGLCNAHRPPSSGVNLDGGRIVQIIQESPDRLAGGRMAEFRRDLGQWRERESTQMQSWVRQRQRDAVTNAVNHRAVKEQQIDVYHASAFRGRALAAQTRLYVEAESEQRKRLDQWRADSDSHVQKIGLVEKTARLGLINGREGDKIQAGLAQPLHPPQQVGGAIAKIRSQTKIRRARVI